MKAFFPQSAAVKLHLVSHPLLSFSVPFSSLCVTPEAWDAGDHAFGSCLCAADAGGACPCWRLPPNTPREVHATHDERTYWTPISRGQGSLCW